MTDYGNGAFFCIANMILDSELLLIIILVYNILTIGTRLTPRCTIIASLLFRAYARASRHVYFNLHPASSNVGVLECSKTVYRCSAFSNFFLPPNEERKQTLFEVYWGLNASLYCSQQPWITDFSSSCPSAVFTCCWGLNWHYGIIFEMETPYPPSLHKPWLGIQTSLRLCMKPLGKHGLSPS